MKLTIITIAATALFTATIATTFASDAAYTGTWKIDLAKSKLTGATFSYAALPGGRIRYSDGSVGAYSFACDGKSYETIPGETIACPKAGPMGYTISYMANGKRTGTETDTVTNGGKMLTIVNHDTFANGKTRTVTTEYTRVGSGTGPIGVWKSAKTQASSPTAFELTATPTAIDYESKLSDAKVALKFDGTKSPLIGPGVPPNLFVIVKAVSVAKLSFVEIIGGKEAYDANWSLSADGKTLSWTGWVPGKKAEATVAVYEKQ